MSRAGSAGLSYSRNVTESQVKARLYAVVGVVVSLAAFGGGELLWRVTVPPGCPGLGACTGAGVHPHALTAMLLGLTAVAVFVWSVNTGGAAPATARS